MNTFKDLNLSKHLQNALNELGFEKPTPIQKESFTVVLSGKDMVGIAQTGTGKTLAYMLPLLHDFKFSKQNTPRILILVPTRELVIQLAEQIKSYARYMSVRVLGVYGGVNINTQKIAVAQGCDILVATPGRVFDLALSGVLQLKGIKKLVIDEVDVLLDLGFRPQLMRIIDILPQKRQSIMFSATMTTEADELINSSFISPVKISIAVSGTPLDIIKQECYSVKNFYTKINLLKHLIKDKQEFEKVLVFVSSKKQADILFDALEESYGLETCIIHANKSQNYRIRSVRQFDEGQNRIIISTDVMARGLDLDRVSHVISFDTPLFPENYMHRIGRTGRAEQMGRSILFYTPAEEPFKAAIENLMALAIPENDFPEGVSISSQLLPEEQTKLRVKQNRQTKTDVKPAAFHEKSAKNSKTNRGGSYKRELAKKYKKPLTKGDKTFNKIAARKKKK